MDALVKYRTATDDRRIGVLIDLHSRELVSRSLLVLAGPVSLYLRPHQFKSRIAMEEGLNPREKIYIWCDGSFSEHQRRWLSVAGVSNSHRSPVMIHLHRANEHEHWWGMFEEFMLDAGQGPHGYLVWVPAVSDRELSTGQPGLFEARLYLGERAHDRIWDRLTARMPPTEIRLGVNGKSLESSALPDELLWDEKLERALAIVESDIYYDHV